jgi:secreted trypsin-like serine protease
MNKDLWSHKNHHAIMPLMLMGLLLIGSTAQAASESQIEPRIVGGVPAQPEESLFMAALLIKESLFEESGKRSNGNITLQIEGTDYTAKTVSGTVSGSFSGTLVDCGLAEGPCEGVSGNVCLIQQGYGTVTEKIQNCQAGGGRAVVLFDDPSNIRHESANSDSIHIPAVRVSAQNGINFLKAEGKSVKYESRISINERNFCGGTFIAKDWVVTAAHCLVHERSDGTSGTLRPDVIEVIPGGEDLSLGNNEVISVKRVVVHKKFSVSSGAVSNDIALVQLQRPTVTGIPVDIIDPVILNAAAKAGDNGRIFGRGTQKQLKPGEEDEGSAVPKLYSVDLPLLTNERCEARFSSLGASLKMGLGDLCVGGLPAGGKGDCHGDSGGPLVVIKNKRPVLAGIVSAGFGCAHPRIPSILTRVPAYAEAIGDVISGRSSRLNTNPVDTTKITLPPIAESQSTTTPKNIATPVTLKGSDPEGSPITFALVDEPLHGRLSGDIPELTYTPNADFTGADSFTFVTNDGTSKSEPATVSITVSPAAVAGDSGSRGGGSMGLLGLILLIPSIWRRNRSFS